MTRFLKIVAMSLILFSCVGQNELSPEEVIIQQKAANALTAILFEYEFDENATYEVEKNGFVNLRIEGFVRVNVYTKAIEALRNHKDIKGVYATQGSKEICPLTIVVR